jgi:two-component system sensor histidine kinase CiaH
MRAEGVMFARVRRRLVVANVVVIAGILVVLGVAVLALMDRLLVDQEASTLLGRARDATAELRFDPGDLVARLGGSESGTFYALWDARGGLVAETAQVPEQALRPSAIEAGTSAGTSVRTTVTLPSGPALVVSVPLDGGRGVLQAGASLQPVRDAETQLTLLILVVGGAGLVLAVAAAWFLAERSMIPIRRALERQQEFAADASHELRTPLSVVDAGLQVLERHPEQPIGANSDVLVSMRQEADRMRGLVEALLTLARADAGAAQLQLAEADIDALVHDVVDSFRPVAEARGITVGLAETHAGSAVVDAERIAELLRILVDNAIRHGGPAVHVTLASRRLPGQVELEVADDGPGIPAAERARVFERFRRGDESRTGNGFGLGLAIAGWIASAHGGRLTLDDNRPGLRVRLTLPASG